MCPLDRGHTSLGIGSLIGIKWPSNYAEDTEAIALSHPLLSDAKCLVWIVTGNGTLPFALPIYVGAKGVDDLQSWSKLLRNSDTSAEASSVDWLRIPSLLQQYLLVFILLPFG
ncbi:hypothetical protein RIF29_39983 [Crotalaria pallida]|uniref:Uncharacterized protein n=1 Tax=Crotalaria pallida TaxID=3830 RepID=A0AAN9HTV9_CROPI